MEEGKKKGTVIVRTLWDEQRICVYSLSELVGATVISWDGALIASIFTDLQNRKPNKTLICGKMLPPPVITQQIRRQWYSENLWRTP